MKKSLKYLFGVILVLMAVGCQDEEDTPLAETDYDAPELQSISITDGATDVSVDLGSITLTYDTPVTLKDASKITMSGVDVSAAAQNLRLNITFGTLEYETEYTLVVSSGAVVATTGGVAAETVSVSFTTEEDPDALPYTPGTPGDYSSSLVTANPIASATAVYEYLLSIYGSKTVSGSMAQVAWNTDEADWVHQWTGKYPAMAFFDYIHLPYSPANWIDYSDITPVSDWWNAGGLVGASWHWLVPTSQGSSDYTYATDGTFDASDAVVSGTWENDVVEADLAKISEYLLLLQDAGIPVIWRPLHEAAGNTYTYNSGAWFWWGADGADAYKALWKYMFEYFNNKGIRNLIWVWTTQTSATSDADYDFYPGDDYVDIVGRDIYTNSSASDIASQYSTIAAMVPNKMVALSELGDVAGIADQWEAGAQWLYYMPWYDYDNDYTQGYAHIYADISWWTSAFNSGYVVDRSELPASIFNN